MSEVVAVLIVPFTVLLFAVYMAFNTSDPMWLVFGAVLAIAMGYFARRIFGS